MSTLFSVIVPIYNKEQYLHQCIDSILNQTYTNFELILVDDGSTDNSKNIIDEYSIEDKRIKVIHKENGGLVSARKSGTRIAIGDYAVCVDADDYVKETYLEKFNDEIVKNNPDIVCSGYCVSNIERTLNYEKGYYTKEDIVKQIYPSLIQAKDTKHFQVNIWAKAYKRELYESIQLNVNDNVHIGEDGCVTIPFIYLANSMSIIDDCGYVYRINEQSMTSNKAILEMEYPKLVSNEYLKYIEINTYDFNEQVNRFIVHQLFIACLSQFNSNKSYKEIKNTILSSFNDSIYSKAVNKAKFSNNLKAKLTHATLKHKLIGIIKVLSLIK